jgi:hypothetical protein
MVKVIGGSTSMFIEGQRVGDVIDIDKTLKQMWDRYALQPQTVWFDGDAYERVTRKVVIHWDPKNGWSMGSNVCQPV